MEPKKNNNENEPALFTYRLNTRFGEFGGDGKG